MKIKLFFIIGLIFYISLVLFFLDKKSHEVIKEKIIFFETKSIRFNYKKKIKKNYINNSYPKKFYQEKIHYIKKFNLKEKSKKNYQITSQPPIKKKYEKLYQSIFLISPETYDSTKKIYDSFSYKNKQEFVFSVFKQQKKFDIFFLEKLSLFLSHVSKKEDLFFLKKLVKLPLADNLSFYLKKGIYRLDKLNNKIL